ncbi:serine protease 58-like isoform X3 [Herpailurus yagouaroundi]|uniref:serine protease 58-like isoform X3 n=1 Tax=Herpailurus yagouaroundi TaxID=1608482 RepID=UPI001AD67CA3|nr:serine protease 58-like isoform X3 [Puma yagouaroundi]
MTRMACPKDGMPLSPGSQNNGTNLKMTVIDKEYEEKESFLSYEVRKTMWPMKLTNKLVQPQDGRASIILNLVTTIIVIPTPTQVKLAQQFNQMSIETAPTFLVFLNSEYEPCLGTLIHKQWVLTAAHCFLPFLEINVAASKENFQNKMGNLRPTFIVQHPDFTRDSAEHDLMLIKLNHPVELKDQVKLVVLPNTTNDRRGEKCTVSGWGWEWRNFNPEPDIQINQTVFWFSNDDCQESLVRKIPIKITENMFCAGSSLENTHSCKELDAVPILCQNQLHGILSWSAGCILKGDIGYYTKVSCYKDWIHKVIHSN